MVVGGGDGPSSFLGAVVRGRGRWLPGIGGSWPAFVVVTEVGGKKRRKYSKKLC